MILNFARVRQLFPFLFLSRRKSRQVETCFAPYPFTWHRWRFSARPFLLCFMYPYPLIVRPMEFRLVFASLALVALEAGQSRRSYFSWFFRLVAASCRILYSCDPVCFSNLKLSCVIFVWLILFYFQYNSVWRLPQRCKETCVKVFSVTAGYCWLSIAIFLVSWQWHFKPCFEHDIADGCRNGNINLWHFHQNVTPSRFLEL